MKKEKEKVKVKNPRGAGRKLKYGVKTKRLNIFIPTTASEKDFKVLRSKVKNAVDIVVNDYLIETGKNENQK
jgi:hypothetical protein